LKKKNRKINKKTLGFPPKAIIEPTNSAWLNEAGTIANFQLRSGETLIVERASDEQNESPKQTPSSTENHSSSTNIVKSSNTIKQKAKRRKIIKVKKI